MSKNYLRNNDKTQRLPEEANSVIIRGAEALPASKNTGPDLQFGSCTEGFFDRHGGLVLTRLG